MASWKIAVIGAGSFVFGPTVLKDALLEHKLNDIELALLDTDPELVNLMAAVARRMAEFNGLKVRITAHTSRQPALDQAKFVICAASREMFKRFQMDCECIDTHDPTHLITEFGGVAGISYSLRQIFLLGDIARDLRKFCPDAWFLTVSNPLPRVTQAMHEEGIRTIGFCSASLEGYSQLWQIMNGEPLAYPFTRAREKWEVLMGGLNHFSWILKFNDRSTGKDLLPELRKRLKEGGASGNPLGEKMGRETGYLLVPNDHHIKDFLAPEMDKVSNRETPAHGTPEERKRRMGLLRNISNGAQGWEDLIAHESWEKPVDLIVSLMHGKTSTFHSLNLINQGQIPALPRNVFVETPCTVNAEGIKPEHLELPPSILPLCQRTAEVTNAIVRAARDRKLSEIRKAIELDPTVLDKKRGMEAMNACLKAHQDILPPFS